MNQKREWTMKGSNGKAMMGIEWDLEKYHDPDGEIARTSRAGLEIVPAPYDRETIDGNCTLNVGLKLMVDLIAGTGPGTPWDETHAYIGVGDGEAPATPDQVGLQGVNKAFAPMDASWPQRSGFVCAWRGTFGPGMGSFTWNEGVICNGPDDNAVCLNRKVQFRGPKYDEDTWIMTLRMKFMADDETVGEG